jgi:choline dehydrogenase-like flavoprotein
VTKLRAGSAESVREVLADAPALIRGHAALAAAKLRRLRNNESWSLKVRANAEQYPTRSSRVALTEARDEYGVPVASLEWRIASEELAAVAASNAQLGAVLRRHNVGTLYPIDVREDWTPKPGIAFHHLGTTRMSATPADGVVDADCQVHGVQNLYVAGCSVFSTGGSANPTFTAVALAVRLARRLATMQERVQFDGVSRPLGHVWP